MVNFSSKSFSMVSFSSKIIYNGHFQLVPRLSLRHQNHIANLKISINNQIKYLFNWFRSYIICCWCRFWKFFLPLFLIDAALSIFSIDAAFSFLRLFLRLWARCNPEYYLESKSQKANSNPILQIIQISSFSTNFQHANFQPAIC